MYFLYEYDSSVSVHARVLVYMLVQPMLQCVDVGLFESAVIIHDWPTDS